MLGSSVWLATAITALAVLLACAAEAAPRIELRWTATSGTGATGASEIEARPGDVLTLDLEVVADADGLTFASLSLRYDSAFLFATAAEECPVPPNLSPGLCNAGGVFLAPVVPGVSIFNVGVASALTAFDASKAPPGVFDDTLTLGRAVFTFAGGPLARVDVFYFPADRLEDDGGAASQPLAGACAGSTCLSAPEPRTATLLAAGLGGLAVWARSRQSARPGVARSGSRG
jgi:hypothetical protein